MTSPKAIFWAAIPCAAVLAQGAGEVNENKTRFDALQSDAYAVLRESFEYDRTVPIDARVVSRQVGDGVVHEKVVIRGARDQRVPGYLALPAGDEGARPCVLLIHGIGGSKDDWWSDESFHGGGDLTERLLASGIAVLTLDVDHHGERGASNDFESPEVFVFERGWFHRARDMIIDSVIDLRRALDYLESRTDIDQSRIGVLGYSMGGMMAMQLTAVDARVTASVSCVAPILKDDLYALGVQNFAPYIDGPPFLMMIGDEDRRNYSPEDAAGVLELVQSSDKAIVQFESGHRLPPEWTAQAAEWIVEKLSAADVIID